MYLLEITKIESNGNIQASFNVFASTFSGWALGQDRGIFLGIDHYRNYICNSKSLCNQSMYFYLLFFSSFLLVLL